MGKSPINGQFSLAMFDYRRVMEVWWVHNQENDDILFAIEKVGYIAVRKHTGSITRRDCGRVGPDRFLVFLLRRSTMHPGQF